jgi:hypothetical protein
MKARLLMLFVSAAAAAIACPGSRPDGVSCRAACEVAERCGMLPSTLGGDPDDHAVRRLEECNERCLASALTDDVAEVITCLAPAAGRTLCEVDACVAALQCMQENVASAAVGAPEVTFRLIEGASWLALFQPQLCGVIPGDFDSGGFEEACEVPGDPCPDAANELAAAVRPPLCGGADCDFAAEVGTENCDPRMCQLNPSPAFDCSYFGIDRVQFGFLNARDELHLDPALHTCSEAAQGVVVPDVPNGIYYPVAVFHGHLTDRLGVDLGLPPADAGREYCWLSWPHAQLEPLSVGWFAHAGHNLAVVPTPDSASLLSELLADPALFPFGCGCLFDNVGCEGARNDNCTNEIDDDSDGLADGEDPGCE